MPEEEFNLHVFGDDRELFWAEDVQKAVTHALRDINPAASAGSETPLGDSFYEKQQVAKSHFYDVVLQFAWGKSVTVPGKHFKIWSPLRSHLQRIIFAHNCPRIASVAETAPATLQLMLEKALCNLMFLHIVGPTAL